MDTQQLHQTFLQCGSVSTDTRKITSGSMFFAIRGERFDANAFAADALSKGASYAVIDNPEYQIDNRTILVDDGLAALQQLAAFHRQYLGIPIVALTGSNGKTTTKELIHAVLSKNFRTGATVGNLNNHIGVPLTLLSFNSQTEIGIVEMGANHQKEIEFLCGIAQPDYGYITNFGKAHLEGFGGTEGVIKGKSEMYDYLFTNDKMAFINLDDSIQSEKSDGKERFTFGQSHSADVVISNISANPFVSLEFNGNPVSSHLIGIYNAGNIAAAIAIGKYFSVPNNDISDAIANYIPTNNRSQLLDKGTNKIILDAYNANPSSMAAALANFNQLDASYKVAILGDMFELGPESHAEHGSIVRLALEANADTIIFVGQEFFQHATDHPKLTFFNTFDELVAKLQQEPISQATLLIKGSRGMALERVLDYLN